jgi:hypothetical protein
VTAMCASVLHFHRHLSTLLRNWFGSIGVPF